MGERINLIAIGIALAMFTTMGFFVGNGCGGKRSDDRWRPQIISYQVQIDSMQCLVDTALAHLDLEYAKKNRVIIKEKIKYITEFKEHEKMSYLLLDTTGRVNYFNRWVRKRTGQD